MSIASPVQTEQQFPDGRVALTDDAVIAGSTYSNGDLAPLPLQRRTWTTW